MKALALFFAFSALMTGFSVVNALFGPVTIFGFTPDARLRTVALGSGFAVEGMLSMSVLCAVAAYGLWRRQFWCITLAQVILGLNLLGDILAATVGHDPQAWWGVPLSFVLLVYLIRRDRMAASHL